MQNNVSSKYNTTPKWKKLSENLYLFIPQLMYKRLNFSLSFLILQNMLGNLKQL